MDTGIQGQEILATHVQLNSTCAWPRSSLVTFRIKRHVDALPTGDPGHARATGDLGHAHATEFDMCVAEILDVRCEACGPNQHQRDSVVAMAARTVAKQRKPPSARPIA